MKTVLILTFLVSCALANYCGMTSCNGYHHIACGDRQNECPKDGVNIIVFNTTHIKTIVDMHNKFRNEIAGGNFKYNSNGDTFDPAARMGTMKWDTELADLCALNVNRCIYKHDECRNTDKFPYAGQNLALLESTAPYNVTDITPVIKAIQMWFDEYKDCNMEYIKNYPERTDKVIGHFTGMIGDNNNAIGCACITYPGGSYGYNYLVGCNYAMTNMLGSAIYQSGNTGSGCKKMNRRWTNLCSTSEVYSYV